MRQGGYLHKNIFDVLHLHQSEGRKYFIRYLKMIIERRGSLNLIINFPGLSARLMARISAFGPNLPYLLHTSWIQLVGSSVFS